SYIYSIANKTLYAFDPTTGNLTSTTDPTGAVTSLSYGVYSQVTQINDTRTTPAEVTNFVLDTYGNVTQITDAANNITKMDYDGRGELRSRWEPNGNLTNTPDPTYKTSYLYNDAGEVLSITTGLPTT